MMQHLVKSLFCLCAAAFTAPVALAVSVPPQLQLLDNTGSPNIVTIQPGELFQLKIRLSSDVEFYGFSAYLQETGNTGPARFTITNRNSVSSADPTSPGNPFDAVDEITSSSPDLTSAPIGTMSPDLGYAEGEEPIKPGTYDVMTLTIATNASIADGTYALQFHPDSLLVGTGPDPVSFNNLDTNIYNVAVAVPEPSSLSCLVVLGLLFRRYRALG